jgi:hypothetical protein
MTDESTIEIALKISESILRHLCIRQPRRT